jgi:hypothetical protein
MRWQTEAAEKKQRLQDELIRVMRVEAEARIIVLILNPDDPDVFYGSELPNIPYRCVYIYMCVCMYIISMCMCMYLYMYIYT